VKARLLVCWLATGCVTPPDRVTLRVELPVELAPDAAQLEVSPKIAEASRAVGRGVVALELKRQAGRVRLSLTGACDKQVVLTPYGRNTIAEIALEPLFDVGPSERVVGLGQAFSIEARPRCREADQARPSFQHTGGAPLLGIRSELNGRRFSATTAETPPAKLSKIGVVPVSARERQRLRSEISFTLDLPDGRSLTRTLGVSPVSRSSGLPNVALTHPVLLTGEGWSTIAQPEAAKPTLRRVGALTELWLDTAGEYRLRDASGHALVLQTARYDHLPLDCGRSDCHAEISESARHSPMTQALASDLGGCHALENPGCASACHATGEPGTRDGGFDHVMSELGLGALPEEHEDLPRALRRLGGVGCLACHGPARIPPPAARAAVISNDVCAVCHDAPPRYGHLAALETTRMAHADGSPETRELGCATCHTTWGALGRSAPEDSSPRGGIGCVACHDVHPHGSPPKPPVDSLLRQLPVPTWLGALPASLSGPSRVCISCHAPASAQGFPEASAVALIAGLGGLDPKTGAAITGTAPHAAAPKGCLSCHDSGPSELTLGKSHGFRASDQACKRCHEAARERSGTLARRARELFEKLAPDLPVPGVSQPLHARARASLTPERARALRNVLLVLEDPAADVHNPNYADALLETSATGATP
jgi:hypothetical protein